jgi:hypothetical protein
VVYLVVLMTTRPAKIAETKRVFADTDDAMEGPGS